MSEQDREITDADALELFATRIDTMRVELCQAIYVMRRMTGARIDVDRAETLRAHFVSLRAAAGFAELAADDLRRRAANPREGGES